MHNNKSLMLILTVELGLNLQNEDIQHKCMNLWFNLSVAHVYIFVDV